MRHLSKHIICWALFFFTTSLWAQEGKLGYQFLNIPVSAHSAALGGANISIVEDDASMMWTNAAMLTNVSDNSIVLGYNSYIRTSNLMSVGYTKAIGERGTWALGAQMLDYGKMDETNEEGSVVGSFSAKDLNFQTSYSYLLSDYWSGAISANPEGYEKTSLLNKAQNLKGRLLVIYGGNDPICVPQHTLSFMRACIDADTYPDLFTYPGDGHNMQGTDRVHLHHIITRYFEDFLK